MGSLGESTCDYKKWGVFGWQRCWKRGLLSLTYASPPEWDCPPRATRPPGKALATLLIILRKTIVPAKCRSRIMEFIEIINFVRSRFSVPTGAHKIHHIHVVGKNVVQTWGLACVEDHKQVQGWVFCVGYLATAKCKRCTARLYCVTPSCLVTKTKDRPLHLLITFDIRMVTGLNNLSINGNVHVIWTTRIRYL